MKLLQIQMQGGGGGGGGGDGGGGHERGYVFCNQTEFLRLYK